VVETREIRGGLHRDYHDLLIHLVIRFLFHIINSIITGCELLYNTQHNIRP